MGATWHYREGLIAPMGRSYRMLVFFVGGASAPTLADLKHPA